MGVYGHRKRFCAESWQWEKNPLLHQGIKPASVAWRSDALPTELRPIPIACLFPFWNVMLKLYVFALNQILSSVKLTHTFIQAFTTNRVAAVEHGFSPLTAARNVDKWSTSSNVIEMDQCQYWSLCYECNCNTDIFCYMLSECLLLFPILPERVSRENLDSWGRTPAVAAIDISGEPADPSPSPATSDPAVGQGLFTGTNEFACIGSRHADRYYGTRSAYLHWVSAFCSYQVT